MEYTRAMYGGLPKMRLPQITCVAWTLKYILTIQDDLRAIRMAWKPPNGYHPRAIDTARCRWRKSSQQCHYRRTITIGRGKSNTTCHSCNGAIDVFPGSFRVIWQSEWMRLNFEFVENYSISIENLNFQNRFQLDSQLQFLYSCFYLKIQ